MKKKTSVLMILLLSTSLIIAFNRIGNAAEAEIGKNIGKFAVWPVSGNLAFATNDMVTGEFVVITDSDLNELTRIQITPSAYLYDFSKNGEKLYVTINHYTEEASADDSDAELCVVNTQNWTVTYYDLPLFPLQIYVPDDNDHLYLACGLFSGANRQTKLVKINTDTGIIEASVDFGEPPSGGLTMNIEETKIYVDSYYKQCDESVLGGPYCDVIKVFDSQTLQLLTEIQVEYNILDLIPGPLGKILVSHGNTETHYGHVSITVISANDDTVDREITIPETIIWQLAYDPLNNYLYATDLVFVDKICGVSGDIYPGWDPTEYVLRIDLSDDSVTWIQVAPEPIGPIALSPDGTRLYAGAADGESPMIYYMNLE